MNEKRSPAAEDPQEEIVALVRRLQETQQRLQELMGGEVDAVTIPGGESYLLHEAQEKLRQSESAQRQLAEMQMATLNALPAHIALLDAQGVVLSVNEAWRRFATANLLQCSEFCIGQNYLEVCAGAQGDCSEEAEDAADGIRRVLRGEATDFSLEYPCHSPAEKRWFRLMATPLQEGQLFGAVVMHVNITERKLAEEELKTSVREVIDLKTALDEHAIVAVTDAQGTITFANDKFCAISKYSREELLGQDHRLLNSGFHSKEFFRALWTTIAQGHVWHGEIKNRAKDGTCYWVDATIVPFLNDEGRPRQYVAIRSDITERKLAEEALREKLENEQTLRHQAAAGEKAKSEFLAVMSHEIRTPMNGILGFAEVLTHDAELSGESRGYVETIRGSGEALLHILDDVLDFSRMEAGRLKIEKVAVSPSALIDEITALFSLQIREKGLDFQHSAAPDVPPFVVGDPGRIRQILVNLVGNAVKFTERGTIRVGVRRSDARLEFFVHDSGSGIADGKIEEVFQAFTQADSSIARRHGGVGLGLTISRRLAGLMGGDLSARSQPGQGSEFSLFLPLEPAEAAATTIVPPQTPLTVTLPPLTVLVVEDDPVNLKLIVLTLRKLGYDPLTARDGMEAVRIYQETRPACILMDMQMPEMDGIEATRRIRQLERDADAPRTFISALSANILPEDRARCFEAGMDFFLNKPVKKQAIADLLDEVARSRALVSSRELARSRASH